MSDSPIGSLQDSLAAHAEALAAFWDCLDRNFDAVQGKLYAVLCSIRGFAPLVKDMAPVYQSDTQAVRRRQHYAKALLEGEWGPNQEYVRRFGVMFSAGGVEYSDFVAYLHGYRQLLTGLVEKDFPPESAQRCLALAGMDLFLAQTSLAITEGYLKIKQETILAQAQAIRELSTPVLKVKEGLLLVPLIGVMDPGRARQLAARLLAATAGKAVAIVIDITAVPAVDAGVASQLVDAAQAAATAGARVYVTGLSSFLADSLTRLGVEFGGVRTFATLREGMQEAEKAK